VPQPTWTPFDRRDLTSVVEAVRALAASGDVGLHGCGIELIIESPPLHWWQWRLRSIRRDQARIAVTDGQGHAGYPVHVRLDTTHGAGAARNIERRPGWVTSNSNGQAVIMMKQAAGRNRTYDAYELVTGAVTALADLHVRSSKRGWRYRVQRAVART
jgi:hypothetical protein